MMSDLISSVSVRTLGTVLVGFGSILLIVVYLVIKRTKQITVSEIWIYPIKSCKGIKLQSSKVVKTGFKYDRQFMLIDDRSAFVSQRKYGNFCKMALIEQKINEDEGGVCQIVLSLSIFICICVLYRFPRSVCTWNVCP